MANLTPSELPSLINLAYTYLSFGWIPIGLVGKRPPNQGWTEVKKEQALGYITEQIDSKRIDNIGIVTGINSNIVVVDLDIREDGLNKWRQLLKDNCDPETFTVETGSGGLHYYFRYDDRVKDLHNGKIRNMGIDFKTTGGQVVAAGSVHPDTGRMYKVVKGYEFDNLTGRKQPILAPIPEFLLALIKLNQ